MIRALLLSLLSFPCFADVWDLYDGNGTTPQGIFTDQGGVTCAHFNAAAHIPWKNLGGDWVDAAGVAQGDKPFSRGAYARNLSGVQTVEMDVTKLMNADGIILRNDGDRVVRIGSRESTTPPLLVLTMSDGSRVTRRATADASLPFIKKGMCQSTPTGKGATITLGISAAVMSFGALPPGAVKASLKLSVVSSYGSGYIETFAMTAPRAVATAANARVAPIANDPGVYYYESWETDDWWTRTGTTARPTAQWVQDGGRFNYPSQGGLWIADGSTELVPAQGTNGAVQLSRGSGAKGRGLMIAYHPTLLGYGVDMSRVILRNVIDDRSGTDPDEAWLTYMVKYGKDFYGFANCEGGKAPGLSGPASLCGGSGSPANGYCGWALRQSYRLICDKSNPAFGSVVLFMYAYHGLMNGYYGQNWFGGAQALLAHEKWHCIEQHVKVNTPGVADGVAELYVNGKLAIERRNVYLRAVKPEPEGYGDWKLITRTRPAPPNRRVITDNFGRSFWFAGTKLDSDLGIQMARMVVHNGGVTPPGKTAQMWLDEIKVSHRRVGCN